MMTLPCLVCFLLALGSPLQLLATARLMSGNTAEAMANKATGVTPDLAIDDITGAISDEASTTASRVSRELIDAPGDFSSWMKDIKDTTLVSDISMPGTHDTMAYKVSHFQRDVANTQQQDLWQQMMGGVRFLDIRLKHQGEELQCWSGNCPNCLDLESSFDEVVETVHNFLQAHPTETILMSIKEADSDSPKGTFSAVVAWYLRWSKEKTKNIVFPAELYYNSTAVPTMAQARGKVILVKRFGIDPSDDPAYKALLAGGLDVNSGWADNTQGCSFNLPSANSTVHLQDYYKIQGDCPEQLSQKQRVVSDWMVKALAKQPQDWYFNFVSIANTYEGFEVSCPIWSQAATMDVWLLQEVIRNAHSQQPLGILIVDYVWNDLTDPKKGLNARSWDLVRYVIGSQRPGTWKNRKGYRLA